MSNIFNDNAVKSSVSEYLKRKNSEGITDNLKDLLLNTIKEIKIPESEVTYQNLPEFIFKQRLYTYRPLELPSNESVKATDVLNARLIGILGAENVELSLPIGETSYIPTYKPSHETFEPHYAIINAVAYHTAKIIEELDPGQHPEKQSDIDVFISLGLELAQVANEVRFSTGTLEGQLRRFKEATNVRNGGKGHHKNKTFKEMRITMQQVLDMLIETLPLNNDEPEIALITNISGYFYTQEEAGAMGREDSLPKLPLSRAAGLPYIGKTKGQTVYENIALASTFVASVSKLIKDTEDGSTKAKGATDIASARPGMAAEEFSIEVLKLLSSDFWYMMCGLMFPKGERYDIESLNEKTRNIWNAPFVTHLLASMISDAPNSRILNVLNCDRFTPSLAKISLMQGGMNLFVTKILEFNDVTHFIYADNIYMYYPDSDEWFSVDLTKGEANATKEMAMTVAMYLLLMGWTDNEGNPLFNMTWAYIALFVIPNCVVDSIALIKNIFLKNPGQGSGNAWTFLINHVASTIVVDSWKRKGRPKPSEAQKMKEIMGDTGIDFKVELHKKDFVKSLRKARDESIHIKDKLKPRTIVEMDLLGYDVTHTEFGYTPILNKDRMLKSVVCPQPASGKFNTNIKKAVHKYIQSFALMTIGSWAYPPIYRAVEELTSNHWKTVLGLMASDEEDITPLMVEEITKSPFADIFELLNLEKPLHKQDWAETFYRTKPVETQVSKNRVPRQVTKDMQGNVNQKSIQLLKNRESGLFQTPAIEKVKSLMNLVYPEIQTKESAEKKLQRRGTTTKMLDVGMREAGYNTEAITDIWSRIYKGTLTPNQASLEHPKIPYMNFKTMSYIPPPFRQGILRNGIFEYVVGHAQSGDADDDMDDYEEKQRLGEKEGIEEFYKDSDMNLAATAYITKTEAILDTMLASTLADAPTPRQAKKVGEISDPFRHFGVMSGMKLGELAAKTGNMAFVPGRSKTQKRRENRNKRK